MRFSFGLPSAGAAANGPDLIRLAQRAEALGFEARWSGDHIFRTGRLDDMLASLEHLAAAVVPAV